MKKIFGLLFIMMMLVSPFTVRASVTANDEKIKINKYETLNLKETLAQESIKEEFKDYKETDDQITIYMFRGNGCGYCQRFLKFLNGITNEYGKYFKLVSFEVWNNADNSELLGRISDFMEVEAGGVPYIIIGNQVFPGYAETYDDGIKAAITELYNAEEKFDVFEEYNKAIDDAKHEEYKKTIRPVIFNAVFVAIGVCIVCYYVKKQNEALLGKITEQRYSTKAVKEESKEDAPRMEAPRKTVNKKRRR